MMDKLWVKKFCIRRRMSLKRNLPAPLKGRGGEGGVGNLETLLSRLDLREESELACKGV